MGGRGEKGRKRWIKGGEMRRGGGGEEEGEGIGR